MTRAQLSPGTLGNMIYESITYVLLERVTVAPGGALIRATNLERVYPAQALAE